MSKSQHLPPRQSGMYVISPRAQWRVFTPLPAQSSFSPVLLSWCLPIFSWRLTSLDAMPHQRGFVCNLAVSVPSARQDEQDEEYDQNQGTYAHQSIHDHPHHRFPERHATRAVWRYTLSKERPGDLCKWHTTVFCWKDRRGIYLDPRPLRLKLPEGQIKQWWTVTVFLLILLSTFVQ